MLKINTKRTYKTKINVTVLDEKGNENEGSFSAVFKILPVSDFAKSDKRLLDEVLVSVHDLALSDDSGTLSGDALLDAVKDDKELALLLIAAYNENSIKKV